MRAPSRVTLIAGPYTPPAVTRGDLATCLFRDGDVIITSWSDGRISWPRCQRPRQRGGSGLLVTDELVRAIKTESSLALQYWFGVNGETVWRWRKFFDVRQWEPEGSRRLLAQNSQAGAEKLRGKKLSRRQVQQRREIARRLGYRPAGRWKGTGWSKKQLALLGRLPDEKVAVKIGRTVGAVCVMRNRLGIRSATDRRRRENKWTGTSEPVPSPGVHRRTGRKPVPRSLQGSL
jgi:hypothetical protein